MWFDVSTLVSGVYVCLWGNLLCVSKWHRNWPVCQEINGIRHDVILPSHQNVKLCWVSDNMEVMSGQKWWNAWVFSFLKPGVCSNQVHLLEYCNYALVISVLDLSCCFFLIFYSTLFESGEKYCTHDISMKVPAIHYL